MSLKGRLLANRFIYSLNAFWKCALAQRQYRRLCRQYPPSDGKTLPLPQLRCRGRDGRPNIFFAGTDEQQDRSGMLQALQRLGQVRWFTRADGSYGQNDPRPESIRRRANAERLVALVDEAAAAGEPPDILFVQTWATLMDPAAFDDIRRRHGTLVVSISMDDRHQYLGHRLGKSWSGTRGLIGHIDLALTAAPECADWYRQEGCPALYFPEASDPAIFHPMPHLPKIHDVSFVGACYGIREEIVMALRRAGIRVSAYGSGWEGGRLPTEEVPRLFAQSKIVLGVGTIGHCRNFHALKLRDFDAPMSGSFYLTHDNPDLAALFERGREIATYRTVRECVEKARYYLGDDVVRESMAAASRARVVRDHTWLGRFASLFAQLQAVPEAVHGAAA